MSIDLGAFILYGLFVSGIKLGSLVLLLILIMWIIAKLAHKAKDKIDEEIESSTKNYSTGAYVGAT